MFVVLIRTTVISFLLFDFNYNWYGMNKYGMNKKVVRGKEVIMISLEKVTAESKIPVRRWITLILAMIMYNTFVVYLVLAVLLGPLNAKHGWSVEAMLLVYTLFMVMAAPSSIIGGKIRDVTGDRTVILLGALIYGIGCVIAGLTSSLIVFFIMVGVLVAFGVNASIIGFVHNIGVLFPEKPGTAMGVFYAGSGLISMLVIPLAASLAGTYSTTFVFVGFGAVAMILCFIFAPLIAVPPKNYTPKGWKPTEDVQGSSEALAVGGIQVGWKKLLKMPSLYLFILAFIATDLIVEALNSNFSLVAQEMSGMDEMTAAWMGSLLAFGTAIGSALMGFMADKIGATRSMALIAILVGAVTGVGLLIGVTVPVFALIAVLVGLSMGTMMVVMPAMTMEFYGEKNFGLNFGILRISLLIAASIGPQLTVRMPLNICFAICATTSILAAIFYFMGNKSINKFKKKHATKVSDFSNSEVQGS